MLHSANCCGYFSFSLLTIHSHYHIIRALIFFSTTVRPSLCLVKLLSSKLYILYVCTLILTKESKINHKKLHYTTTPPKGGWMHRWTVMMSNRPILSKPRGALTPTKKHPWGFHCFLWRHILLCIAYIYIRTHGIIHPAVASSRKIRYMYTGPPVQQPEQVVLSYSFMTPHSTQRNVYHIVRSSCMIRIYISYIQKILRSIIILRM